MGEEHTNLTKSGGVLHHPIAISFVTFILIHLDKLQKHQIRTVMVVLNIIGIILVVIAVLLVLAYLIQPALLTLPYTAFISFFVKNPPFLNVEEHFPQHKLLQENWGTIRAELEEVLKNEQNVPKFHEVDSIQRFISAKDEMVRLERLQNAPNQSLARTNATDHHGHVLHPRWGQTHPSAHGFFQRRPPLPSRFTGANRRPLLYSGRWPKI